MAVTRIPIKEIGDSSFPFGRDKCLIITMVADGTIIAGDLVKADTTNPNKAITATVGAELGIVAKHPDFAWVTAITADTVVEVVVKGPTVALVVTGNDTTFCGFPLSAHADNGTLIPTVGTAASATSTCATLLDYRANDASERHIVQFNGLALNDNTHAE